MSKPKKNGRYNGNGHVQGIEVNFTKQQVTKLNQWCDVVGLNRSEYLRRIVEQYGPRIVVNLSKKS